MRQSLVVAVIAALLATACPDRGPRVLPRDPTKPYVVTAIDYHFHDAHPTPRLARTREIVFSNQGRNVHNVTIPGTTVVLDIKPGERISLGDAGPLLRIPGRRRFVCRYHVDRGMTGVLVLAR